MKTLEKRCGQPIQVSQACIEDLISAYGDSVSLQYFAEKLNTDTNILRSDVECEASVATNLNTLSNDVIIRERGLIDVIIQEQTKNYEILSCSKPDCLPAGHCKICERASRDSK